MVCVQRERKNSSANAKHSDKNNPIRGVIFIERHIYR